MAGIYTQNNHRNYPFLCKYYKKIIKSDNSLKHKENPDGYFYCREIEDKEKESQEIVGSFQVPYETGQIETPDDINIEKNDIVNFCDNDWLVDKVVEKPMNKRGEFCTHIVKRKIIALRK